MASLGGDLKSGRLIVLKGVLFLACAVMSGGLLVLRQADLATLLLVALLAWASARFYYFLFYVLHTYVDPSLRYSGVASLIGALWSRRRGGPEGG
jgi:hypothetical protein